MNVGWLRIGNPIDVDYMDSSVFSLNTGIRLGCWEAFVQLGHKVFVLSYVKPKHRHLFQGGTSGIYTYDWMKHNVFYEISKDPDELDVVILEYGPGSTMFSHSPDDEEFLDWVGKSSGVSYWYYLRYLLEAAEGHRLVYFTANGNRQLFLRCPLLREQCGTGDYTIRAEPELSEYNIRSIFDGIDWSQYRWECWSNALNTKRLVELHEGSVPGSIMSAWYSTPVGYSDIYDPLMDVKHISKPVADFVYVGHQRDANRTAKLLKFFGDAPSEHYDVHVWGKWTADHFNPRKISFMGPTQNQGVTPLLYNDSVASLFVGEKSFEHMGTMTPRIMIASRAGSVVFMDRDVHLGDVMAGGEEFLVGDADELLDKYEDMCLVSEERRLYHIGKQRDVFLPWRTYVSKVLNGAPDEETVPIWDR